MPASEASAGVEALAEVEELMRRLGDIERLALGNPVRDVKQHDVAQLLAQGSIGRTGAQRTGELLPDAFTHDHTV